MRSSYHRKWARANRGKINANQLRHVYGIEPEDKKNVYKAQRGLCAVCRIKFDINDLCVDHDARSGIVRGLLCHGCNRGLGLFKENKVNIRKAVEYLKERDFSFIHGNPSFGGGKPY